MRPVDLVDTAQRLVASSGRKPRQSDLRRAVSSAYYALFHALCRSCADGLVGGSGSDRSNPAWRQVYRAIEHGFAKGQCSNKAVMGKFAVGIREFAEEFVSLQVERHRADYDPFARFTKTDAMTAVAAARAALTAFEAVPLKHRRAFAVWVTLKDRP